MTVGPLGMNGQAAEPLLLVHAGRTEYAIAVDESADRSVQLAAKELAHYVELATDAELPIRTVVDWDAIAKTAPLIVVGQNDYTRSLGIQLGTAKPESAAIRTNGRNLIIAGDDMTREGKDGDPLHTQHHHFRFRAGTLLGVYRFLHDELGIRWFQPGELWEDVPRTTVLRVKSMDRLIEPAFVQRGISTSFRHLDKNGKRRTKRILEQCLWLRRTGNGAGIRGTSSHNMWQAIQRFVKDGKYVGKPEWVALVGGTRRVPTGGNLTKNWYKYQLCTSNPEVIDLVVAYVDDFFAKRPDYDICGIGMNDGDGFCECVRCRALDAPDSDSLTDRICTFYREVGERVAGRHPGKFVGGFVYANYVDLPERIDSLPDNLLLTYVTNGSVFYKEQDRQAALARFRAWCEFHKNVQFYAWPVSHGFFGLPTPDTAWVRELFRNMQQTKAFGVRTICMGSLTAKQPDGYLYAALLGDPSQNVNALLDEYYSRMFGPAADHVRKYHSLIEAQIRNVSETLELGRDVSDDAIANHENRILKIYGPVLASCRQLLDEARQASEDPKVRKRLDVFSRNFRLVELMHEAIVLGRRVYGAGQAAPADVKALDRVRATYHKLLRLHGYTDVLDVRSISYIPSRTLGNLRPYLLLPSDLDKWHRVPVAKRPSSVYSALGFIYEEPKEALSGDLLLALPTEWRFRPDPKERGQKDKWFANEVGTEWQPIRIEASWTTQGHADHHGVAWYDVTFQTPDFPIGRKLWLLFHAVDGQAWVWIDGKPVGNQLNAPTQMWNKSWALDVTKALRPNSPHRISIRVRKQVRAAGIWKPVELRGR